MISRDIIWGQVRCKRLKKMARGARFSGSVHWGSVVGRERANFSFMEGLLYIPSLLFYLFISWNAHKLIFNWSAVGRWVYIFRAPV